MYRKCERGFILQDLLLSLACLLMIAMFFLPFYKVLIKNYENINSNINAEIILNDYLTKFVTNQSLNEVQTIKVEEFLLTFKLDGNHLLGCIEWFNQYNNKERMCRYVPEFIE